MTDSQLGELLSAISRVERKAEEARREAGHKGHFAVILLLIVILLSL